MDFEDYELILLANWFLMGRYLYGLGSLVEAKTGFNFRELGTVLNTIAILVMLAQIAGFDVFEMI